MCGIGAICECTCTGSRDKRTCDADVTDESCQRGVVAASTAAECAGVGAQSGTSCIDSHGGSTLDAGSEDALRPVSGMVSKLKAALGRRGPDCTGVVSVPASVSYAVLVLLSVRACLTLTAPHRTQRRGSGRR